MARLSSCDRDYNVHKTKILTIWSFIEKNLPTSVLGQNNQVRKEINLGYFEIREVRMNN